MALLVVRPGAFATVQDLGRPGHRRFGVPVGGAADLGSFRLANALLGNPPDVAALELTLVGGAYRAEVDLPIALAGAPMRAGVEPDRGERRPWPIPGAGTLRAGETLVLGGTPAGSRCYLAVRGGWQAPVLLGSRSAERPLRAGDRLVARSGTTTSRRPAPEVVAVFATGLNPAAPLRWLPGPDFDPARTRLDGPYRVLDRSDRVGVRLDGAPVPAAVDPDRPSAPVAPGAIQVAGGQPILLGVAGGTIGGYPHVGHVAAADLDRLGQLRPGDLVRFRPVDLAEARRLDADRRRPYADWQARLAIWAGA